MGSIVGGGRVDFGVVEVCEDAGRVGHKRLQRPDEVARGGIDLRGSMKEITAVLLKLGCVVPEDGVGVRAIEENLQSGIEWQG